MAVCRQVQQLEPEISSGRPRDQNRSLAQPRDFSLTARCSGVKSPAWSVPNLTHDFSISIVALSTRVQGALLLTPIPFEDYLVFTSGYQDPLLQIQSWSAQSPDLGQSPANAQSSSAQQDSQSRSIPHGSDTISWDHSLNFQDSLIASSVPLSLFSSSPCSSSLNTSTSIPLADPHAAFLEPSGWAPFPNALQSYNCLNDFSIEHGVIPPTTSSGGLDPLSSLTPNANDIHGLSPSLGTGKATSKSAGSSPQNPNKRSLSPSECSTPRLSDPISTTHSKEPPTRVEKRKQNTLAARRYRQKRVDQMTSLESTLKETQSERDGLKMRVARLEGEVETLRALLHSQK